MKSNKLTRSIITKRKKPIDSSMVDVIVRSDFYAHKAQNQYPQSGNNVCNT